MRADGADFTFDDPGGRLEWAAPDRAVLTLHDTADTRAPIPEVVELVGRWMRATAEPGEGR